MKIITIFGGDMITGEIHEELAKTNDALSAPAVRECAERLAGLVIELRKINAKDILNIATLMDPVSLSKKHSKN
jgi:hypothetical protein